MDSETRNKIEETVMEILRSSNIEETTEYMIRKSASEKLDMDLSEPSKKMFVREVVESYLRELQAQAEEQEREEAEVEEDEEEVEEEKSMKSTGEREYDDEGGLIICRLSDKRRVTLSDFRGKKYISIREYYKKDGKELPSAKGLNLTPEQWALFSKNVSAIEKAITKMESR